MGNSLTQWRGAIGGFYSRMCSSGWTNGSASKAKAKTLAKSKMKSQKESLKGIHLEVLEILTSTKTAMITVFQVIMYLAVMSVIMMMTHHVPSASRSVIEVPMNHDAANLTAGPNYETMSDTGESTDISVMPFTIRMEEMLLILCGDVEVNPGPAMDDNLTRGIAQLILDAPTDNIKDVLGKWAPDNDVAFELNKLHVPVLKEALAWLWNSDPDIVKKKLKPELVSCVHVAIEALLPDTCSICQEEYSVGRQEIPATV